MAEGARRPSSSQTIKLGRKPSSPSDFPVTTMYLTGSLKSREVQGFLCQQLTNGERGSNDIDWRRVVHSLGSSAASIPRPYQALQPTHAS
mmetsp:Transcript_47613/g.64824  ORF Transcript_47613/g.64824 Transcript_47613/m.64824 type:complete len:90 (-) Transcript_47613:233-502(-)